MKSHVLKLAAFGGLQAAILLLLVRFGDVPAPPPSSGAPRLSEEERLTAFLSEYLYKQWRRDRDAIDDFAASPPGGALISAAANSFFAGPDNYIAALVDKDDLLKNAPGPRMIFLGGSGLAFGLDSQLIADRYGYTPINYGLHIRLGPGFMLRHVREYVRPGDVVVLSVEYSGMFEDFEAAPEPKAAFCAISPDFERFFGDADGDSRPAAGRFAEAKRYADQRALADFARFVRVSAAGIGERLDPSGEAASRAEFQAAFDARRDEVLAAFRQNPSLGTTLYRRSFFNEFGDFTGHLAVPDPLRGGDKTEWYRTIRAPILERGEKKIATSVARLNAFAAECRRKDVRVYFAYPPLIDAPQAEQFAKNYAALVERDLRIPVLGPIEEMIYGLDCFFDTQNHLCWPGVRRRTATLAAGLDRYVTPRTSETIAAQVAARDREVTGRWPLAAASETTAIR